jgi:AcrR family transcriptional regulator
MPRPRPESKPGATAAEPRTRSRRLPADERRAELLAAAVRVFSREGFHGATTRAIAREAGVAEALLYRYFADKKDLFVCAVRETSARLVQGLKAVLDAHADDPIAAIDALLDFARRRFSRAPELAKMTFIVSAELDDADVRAAYLENQRLALGALVASIDHWKTLGRLRDDVPTRGAAWLVLGSFQLVALMKNTGRLEDLDTSAALGLVRAFLGTPTL